MGFLQFCSIFQRVLTEYEMDKITYLSSNFYVIRNVLFDLFTLDLFLLSHV